MILLVTIIFLGYSAIILENVIRINKSASALLTGVLCWIVYAFLQPDHSILSAQLKEHIADISGIIFFLIGALSIVKLIDAHDGFNVITDKIHQTSKRKLLWIISLITFILSPVLDNLTTCILMITLIRKLIKDPKDRLFFSGMIIIAANAGGAWSPIGDVTTTMLWIGNQITAYNIMAKLILPCLVCLIFPIIILTFRLSGNVESLQKNNNEHHSDLTKKQKIIVLISGMLILISVPIFKSLTGLPPYMAVLTGLGILWIITEIMHDSKKDEDKHFLSVTYALQKIDTPGVLFFLGILISVAALQSSAVLTVFADWMNKHIGNEYAISFSVGLSSSVIDNVPLVAAVQGMFPLTYFPTDHNFWTFLSYCTGTGGSILIIGSAAGIAAMSLEKISFSWYLRNISWLALIGYILGAIVYLLQ
jgi:Na+/H+ antiporter NhaD/arsenite permease-like protein